MLLKITLQQTALASHVIRHGLSCLLILSVTAIQQCDWNKLQDNLAMNAIRFLTTVASGVHHALFKDENTLKQVCEKIVIPNLMMREDDEEMFELNWVEYVRRDTEGSDSDTRRRAAAELVKSLTAKFSTEASTLNTNFSGIQNALLSLCIMLFIWAVTMCAYVPSNAH